MAVASEAAVRDLLTIAWPILLLLALVYALAAAARGRALPHDWRSRFTIADERRRWLRR
jgi:hypothetical protein